MDNEIRIMDVYLAILIKDTLENNGNRDQRYKDKIPLIFTKEELATITELKLEGKRFEDISDLKYCVNLKELSIISANAKNINTEMYIDAGDETIYEYLMKKNNIKNFSVISDLENLTKLTISYDDNITSLDVSRLSKLEELKLDHNPNLTEVKGLENATELSDLILQGNNISHSFDLFNMSNENLTHVRLDFDMFPILKQQYPNIEELENKQQRYGLDCKWVENLSNIRENEISTMNIGEMDRKAQEILNSIIQPEYNDIEKICAIYAYIVQNVKYDYESLAASRGEKNSALEEAMNDYSNHTDRILDRKQSSYNVFTKGKGVCEGYTNAMHYLLNSVGVKSKTVSCSSELDKTVGRNSNHSVIKVKIGNDWYYCDPTWDAGQRTLKNFLITKQGFSKNHALSMAEYDVQSPEKKAYSDAELSKIMEKVIQDRERKKQNKKEETMNYEKPRSSRSDFSVAKLWDKANSQNINEPHEMRMARESSEIPGLDYRIMKYSSRAPEGVDSFEYALKKIGEDYYASELEGEKAELAKQFGILEGKALSTYYNHYNIYGENTLREENGYNTNEPKRLLQFEKVNGLNIKETEETKELDTTSLNQDIFVATYELRDLYDGRMEPVKEYYIKNKEGNFEKIGETISEGFTTFNLDNERIEIEDDCIIQGNTLEKVTQSELADEFLKNEIEASYREDKEVKEVLQITDEEFLKDFVKQIGHDDWEAKRSYIYCIYS